MWFRWFALLLLKMTCNRYLLCLGLWIWFYAHNLIIIWHIWSAIKVDLTKSHKAVWKQWVWSVCSHTRKAGIQSRRRIQRAVGGLMMEVATCHGMLVIISCWEYPLDDRKQVSRDRSPKTCKKQKLAKNRSDLSYGYIFSASRWKLSQADSLILALQDPELRTK